MDQTLMLARICCVYMATDEALYVSFEEQFRLLTQQKVISSWWGHKILSRVQDAYDWADLFDDTQIVFLLVTRSFLASPYGERPEVKYFIERQRAGKLRVLPLVFPTVFNSNWITQVSHSLQLLGHDSIPIPFNRYSIASSQIEGIIRGAQEDLFRYSATEQYPVLSSVWRVPYPRLVGFLGREELLTRLRDFFQSSRENRCHVLAGIPGVGKTQIAIEYLYRYAHDYQAIFWINAESQDASFASFTSMGRFSEPLQRDRRASIEAVKQWLQTHTKWLLVCDDVRDFKSLQAFIPATHTGHILCTTSVPFSEITYAHTEVEPFLNEEGALCFLQTAMMLDKQSGMEGVSHDNWRLALQISQELRNLPLALEEAGAYVEVQEISLQEYLHRYHHARQEVLQKDENLVISPSFPALVATYLVFKSKFFFPAAQILRLYTLLGTARVPEDFFLYRGSYLPWRMRLLPLPANAFAFGLPLYLSQRYALMRRDFPTKMLYVHPLTLLVAEKTIAVRQKKQWILQAIQSINANFLTVDVKQWDQCERYLPQVFACIRLIRQEHITTLAAGRLLDHAALYLQERISYAEAAVCFGEALAIYRKRLGPRHKDTERVKFHYESLLHGK